MTACELVEQFVEITQQLMSVSSSGIVNWNDRCQVLGHYKSQQRVRNRALSWGACSSFRFGGSFA